MAFLRWIACLPAGASGGVLAGWLMKAFVLIGIAISGPDPSSWPARFHLEVMSGVGLGADFVYCCVKIAPDEKLKVAYGSAVLAILILGFLMFPAIVGYRDAWPLINAGGALAGVIGMTVTAHEKAGQI